MSNQAVNEPKLTLFAFQLRNNLALGDEPVKNADALWHKCEEIGQQIHAPELSSLKQNLKTYEGKIGVSPGNENLSSDYLELLDQRLLSFTAIPDQYKGELKGSIYPLQIHDIYAVDITLRYLGKNLDIQQLSYLNFKGYLLPSEIKASLGQTLLLFVQPVDEHPSNVKNFANNCLNAVLSPAQEKLSVPIVGEGKFLNSPIFEYESNQDNINKNLHILIWLNNTPLTTDLEDKGDYYQPLMNLLSCRHKILYTYSQARWCNQQARNIFQELENKVNNFRDLPTDTNKKLALLQEWLLEIPKKAFEYANYIRDLQIHRTTIETNKINYEYWLGKLYNISLKNCDNLDFWHKFIKQTQDKFIAQINTDLNYLIPGQQLFQEMVATIRGIVEIEQAQIDGAQAQIERSLENKIQVLGVAFGGGSIISGIVTQHIDKPFAPGIINFKYPVHPLVSSLLWSVLATVILAQAASWFLKRNEEKKHN